MVMTFSMRSKYLRWVYEVSVCLTCSSYIDLNLHVDHLRTSLSRFHGLTNSAEQLDQTLNGGLVGKTFKVEKLEHTLVHDAQGQHAKLVQFSDELDKTETLTLSGLGDVVFFRKELRLLLPFWNLGQVDFPTPLEFLLAAILSRC
jgi:hypothetical protein